ncbi:polyhydroxyalkanoic acid system family protein [Lacipirellula sp.]|uniref:polyhydroxyalkanoic acid system family protein n=1 Tax=Lacipirellula sp. TaxID=2691419 RepID=UPI003D0AC66B
MSKPITISLPHQLGREEARRRIEQGFAGLAQGMTGGIGALLTHRERWEGDCLIFDAGALGQKIAGRVDVLDDSVKIEIDLPAFLASIREHIIAKLKVGGQKLLT